jgi:polynucleotide 5'-kinase involved in rRNA processing
VRYTRHLYVLDPSDASHFFSALYHIETFILCVCAYFSSYFIGEMSPKNQPVLFMQAVDKLLEEYRMHLCRAVQEKNRVIKENEFFPAHSQLFALPLVLNTAGWVKGMGQELLDSMLDRASPSIVLQVFLSSPCSALTFIFRHFSSFCVLNKCIVSA